MERARVPAEHLPLVLLLPPVQGLVPVPADHGELAVRNPAFLTQFDDESMKEPVS